MVRLSVKIDTTKATKGLGEVKKETEKASQGDLYRALFKARSRLMTYPPKAEGLHPDLTARQRRFLAWAIRTGKIEFPYKRTGRYNRGWVLRKIKNGYVLSGRASQKGRDYTKFVSGSAYGTGQARIHQGRWLPMRDAVEDAVATLPQSIADTVVMVSRREGFEAR